MTLKRCLALFRQADDAGSGQVSRERLEEVFREVNPTYTSEQFARLMKAYDPSKQEQVDYERFLAWVFKVGKKEAMVNWWMVHYHKHTEPVPLRVGKAAAELAAAVAAGDGVFSVEEARFVQKLAESQGWFGFDSSSILSIAAAAQACKDNFRSMGLEAWTPVKGMELLMQAVKACSADGAVALGELEALREAAESFGLPRTVVDEHIMPLFHQEMEFKRRQLSVIYGNESGRMDRHGGDDDYGEGEETYVSCEQLYSFGYGLPLTRSDIARKMQVIAAIAAEDGITSLERHWIESYSAFCGAGKVDLEKLPALEELPGIIQDMARRTGLDASQLASELIYNSMRAVGGGDCTTAKASAIGGLADAFGLDGARVNQLDELADEEVALQVSNTATFAQLAGLGA